MPLNTPGGAVIKRFSVKGGMYLVILSIMLLFALMMRFAVTNSRAIRDLGLKKTETVMFEDQKAKLRVAVHSMAVTLGRVLAGINDDQARIDMIRVLINDIRFEEDQSGYYFVYDNTTNVALPAARTMQGSDMEGNRDANGVFYVREMMRQASKGGGFVRYVFPKPQGHQNTPKLAYAEMIPGTRLWIGGGVYLDNIDAYVKVMVDEINGETQRSVTVMAVGAGLVFLASIVIILTILAVMQRTIAHFQRRLERLATTDKLTGLHNRHSGEALFNQAVVEAQQQQSELSVILLDIDHFKRINDQYGHLAGDAVLLRCACIIRSCLRGSDIVCRWGGEEFLVILKDCGIESAVELAEKIRSTMAQTSTIWETSALCVQCSLGVAQWQYDEQRNHLLTRADQAMYRAKNNGRNRTERSES